VPHLGEGSLMADLYVDLDAIGQLVGSLGRIHDGLAGAPDEMRDGGYGTGSDAVYAALHHFQTGWKDGRKTIIQEVGDLAQAARGSAQAYAQAEDSISRNAQTGGVATRTVRRRGR
jgi:GAF domain-containing protein